MLFQETEAIELKQDYSESIRKDIIAFANTEGLTAHANSIKVRFEL